MSSIEDNENDFEGIPSSPNYVCDEYSFEGFEIDSTLKKNESLNTIIGNPFGLKEDELNIKIEPIEIKEELTTTNEPLKIKEEIEIKNEPLFEEDIDPIIKKQNLGIQKYLKKEDIEKYKDDSLSCLIPTKSLRPKDDGKNKGKIISTEQDEESMKSCLKEKKIFECKIYSHKANLRNNIKKALLINSNSNLPNSREENLKPSLLTRSDVKLFKCWECQYECSRKITLKNHLLTHSDIKLFKCSECQFESNYSSNFNIHILTHTDINVFKCSECQYESKYKNNLKLHLLTHSDIKLFKCSECQYECKRKWDLKSHLLTHSDMKLFKCSECQYESNHKSCIKSHLLTHLEIKLFKCSKCQYESNYKSSLNRHLFRYHSYKK